MRFYLGTHCPAWLAQTDVPLFLSYRRLAGRRRLPKALGPWALDSGGFSELATSGRWTYSPARYADDVRRFATEIGSLDWACTQDWMVEPEIRARTGLSVRDHQERTVGSFLELRLLAPEIPWVPVLQGWALADYLDHVAMYARAGVDLRGLPVVGVGSICRRQHTIRAAAILRWLASDGLRLHAFGFKLQGLATASDVLASADSLAWSYHARRSERLPECSGHRRCTSCLRFALEWRARVLDQIERAQSGSRAQAG
jgi:hypothetical protein